MQVKNPARRRMRINAVFNEWLRSPFLLVLPAVIVALALLADVTANAGFVGVASSFALMSHGTILVLLGLLLVAFLRL
jgi:hypothetical protein